MTLTRFVVKNSLRNKRRTALTVLSIGVSLFLLIALRTMIDQLMNPPASPNSDLRLVVRRSTVLGEPMPLAYFKTIERLPHVKHVTPMQWFGGQYKDPKNFFPNIATLPERLWELYPEYKVSDEVKKAFASERMAAVAGVDLMNRFGWKPGEVITLEGTILDVNVELRIVGNYESENQRNALYFNWEYLNEALGQRNTVSTFWIVADSADNVPAIIDSVDAAFRNTPAETKTETEKSFVLGFTKMLGNIQFLIGVITGVIVFTMLLVSASTMAMTIRERFREIGILKSLGYPNKIVLALILGEAVFLSLAGAAVGSAVAAGLGFVDFYSLNFRFLRSFDVGWDTYALAVAVGVGIGVCSGLIPALQASKMTILDAMRRMD